MWVLYTEKRAGRVGTEQQKSQSVSCPLLSPELCSFTVPTYARELLQLQTVFYTFFPERGVKHQGAPMHTLHRPKNFEIKDFWKSSAEKTWQNTMWDFPHTCEGYLSCHLGCQSFVLPGGR